MTFDRSKATEGTQCPMCSAGTLRGGTTTLTMERDGATIVFKEAPADVCDVCGEAYVEEEVSAAVSEKAEEALKDGVQFGVRRWEGGQKAKA